MAQNTGRHAIVIVQGQGEPMTYAPVIFTDPLPVDNNALPSETTPHCVN